ncbi:MAG: DNA cytosine methyltransferase [Flavobacteriales bacterium]|jgi:DNA (cytosine-5)-methyltransferase 1|nr:DNA cytosine methyltransferase [Flavobacteriales bacterium]MCB0759035.1 DNA cytosine methyltransferase [Flavobacteriales bacterium]
MTTKTSNMRTAISLFSGAGGMDIGVRDAGFEVLASIERDKHCCETLRENIKRQEHGTVVIERDIRDVEPEVLRDMLGLDKKPLDLLFGGPPCQAFSQIGKQAALEDERGLLLFEMVRFAEVLRPKVIFIEQVKGLISARDHNGKPGGVLEMLLRDLQKIGYSPKWKLLNSAEYGVAQQRKRVFIVATDAKNTFDFPAATHQDVEKKGMDLFELKPFVGVGEVLKGIGKPVGKNEAPGFPGHIDVTPARDKERICGVPEGGHLAAQLHLPKEQVGKLSKKDTTKYLRLSRSRPSNTLRCGEIFFHPVQSRYLTPREYMRIHGYPDEYVLSGPVRSRSGRVTDLDQHRQVANSVPPPLAKAIASEIARFLQCQASTRSLVTH